MVLVSLHRWTLFAVLAATVSWRTTAFSTTTPSAIPTTPVVPQDSDSSVVENLKEHIHSLRHEISLLQEGDDNEGENAAASSVPWKQWYADAEERNRAMASARNQQVEDAIDQIDCLQTALELSDAEKVCVEAELDRLHQDYAALQSTLDTVRQHHAENCAQWQASLDTAELQLQQLQQQSLEELQLIQEAASLELETTVAAYEAELSVVKSDLTSTTEKLQQRERKLQHRGNRILILEQEKKSLRMLFKNSVRLVMRRFNQRAELLVSQSMTATPKKTARQSVTKTLTAPPSPAAISYQEEQKQQIQAIREKVAVSSK